MMGAVGRALGGRWEGVEMPRARGRPRGGGGGLRLNVEKLID